MSICERRLQHVIGIDCGWPYLAIVAFCAWLTTREEVVTLSARHHPGRIVELLDEFCKSQGWSTDLAKEHWDLLKPYPKEEL